MQYSTFKCTVAAVGAVVTYVIVSNIRRKEDHEEETSIRIWRALSSTVAVGADGDARHTPAAASRAAPVPMSRPNPPDEVPQLSPPDEQEDAVCTGGLCTASNRIGTWRWRKDGAYRHDMLVVMGGMLHPIDSELLDLGYMVWTVDVACSRKGKPGMKKASCSESHGYVNYLADPDPKKPVAKSVAFLHGHAKSWHTLGYTIPELLERARHCAPLYHRYFSLNPTGFAPAIYRYHNMWKGHPRRWNQLFGEFRSIPPTVERIVSPHSAQFVVPADVVRNNLTFWGKALEYLNSGKTSGYFWEYMWHVALGEDIQPDVYALVPACLPANDRFEDPTYAKLLGRTLEGVYRADRKMQEIRTFNTGGKWKSGVLVVIGCVLTEEPLAHTAHPLLIKEIQRLGYNVWLRHPESVACKMNTDADCAEQLGYLTFLGRHSKRQESEVLVFLRGNEEVSVLKRLTEAIRCARGSDLFVALGSGTTKAAIEEEVLALKQRRKCRKEFKDLPDGLAKIESKYAGDIGKRNPQYTEWPREMFDAAALPLTRLGSHFVVTQRLLNSIPDDYFQIILDVYNFHEACLVGLLQLYWHVLFGAPAVHPAPFSDKICVKYTPRKSM
eukprot:TRINITY_DN8086_c0_g1_i1.p1 TRINITY_DN8086_c0_g1~~TRINITY_DN8086_c0_g1_i1.p1  ORF type:complete len:611 (+),score=59.79 TRINITY_DN8086_c0_g1_i1:1947-3779(+)